MVKANAYGHGAVEVVNALSGIADAFAVALIDEAIEIRDAASGKEILVFTPPTTEEEGYALAVNAFTASVGDLRSARLIVRVCQKYGVSVSAHLKVNTGMNRYGFRLQDLGKACKLFKCEPRVRVTGIYSHLYATDAAIAMRQRAEFLRAVGLAKGYFSELIAHLSATYGALLGEKFAFDRTRIGLGLYGYLPVENPPAWAESLKKALRVYAKIVGTRTYAHGGVGYGMTSGKRGERLYLRRYGYADGFLRCKENGVDGANEQANALCMDVCVCKGRSKYGAYSPVLTDAEGIAKRTGTIVYEVLCAATRRATFRYQDADEGRKRRKKDGYF